MSNDGNTVMLLIPLIPIFRNSLLDCPDNCLAIYDLKDILMTRELHDAGKVDLQMKWSSSFNYLLKNFSNVSLHTLFLNTKRILTCIVKHDQQSSNCLYAFIFNSITIKPCDHVVPTYNETTSCHQGRITLTK